MLIDHIHLKVSDLPAVKVWFENCLKLQPISEQRTDRLLYGFGTKNEFVVVFEQGEIEAPVTLGLHLTNPQEVFDSAVASGALIRTQPSIYPNGSFKAYLQGPCGLVIELEGNVSV